MEANPKDARAAYYLGNLLYDWQPGESIALWERSSVSDPNFPIIWRNLAIAYSHQQGENSQQKAIASLEKAVVLTNPCPTHFAELDRLYQAAGTPVQKRLEILERNQKIVLRNDEALGSLINLKIFAGKADEAILLLQGRTFSIWEGATPFNTGQAWADAHLVKGLQLLKVKKYNEAIEDFNAALDPPENLRADQRRGSYNAGIAFWAGCAYEASGEKEKAQKSWNDALVPNLPTGGPGGGGGVRRFGNNSLIQGEQRYYQALAKQKLGNKEGNEAVFNELVTSAASALNKPGNADVDATQAIGRQPSRNISAMAHYNAGLGYAGLGNKSKAREEFNAALTILPDYINAKIALDQLIN